MKTKVKAILMVFILSFAGCSSNMAPVPLPPDIVLSPKSVQLVNSANTFTFNLFKKIPDTEGHNVMISPLSISLALSMTLNGAEGTTRSDMTGALGFHGLSVDDINGIYSGLIASLKQADPDVRLNIANSIRIRKGFPVLEPFIAANRKYYDAQVENSDFNQAALDEINNWVSEKTYGKIPVILDQISADEIMFLINAIYFNGKWQVRFDASQTETKPFNLSSGLPVNVPLMKIKEKFGYAEKAGYRALKMPYGRGKFSMIVLLPDAGKSTDQIVSQLSPSSWQSLKGDLNSPVKVDVRMPRFKFTWEHNLNDILSSMGMSVAFSESQANFSKINIDNQLFITKVIHKTFIEVNEEGTEAAAATSVGIGVTSVGPGEPEFHVTRPFLFFITEHDTDAILFAGKVENPLLTN